jgi:hypothetical protein
LSVADIQRWSAEAVREVFHAATARGNATLEASRQLSTLAVFDTWEGLTAEARKHTNALIRQDLDDHGNESLAVARAAGKAADDIEHVQSELRTLRADAAALHMTIDAVSNKVVPTKNALPGEAVVAEIQLQPRLDKIIAEANAVDAELAAAINMAEGNAPGASPPPSAPVNKQSGDAPTPGGPSQAPGSNDRAAKAPAQGQPPSVLDALTAATQGKPDPTDQHYTRSPLTDPVVAADPSVVARQAGKVADARRALDGAQAKLDAAARDAYTQGPGAGPGRDVTDPLSQAVFDARRNLTEQSAILDDLNKSAAATGAAQPIPTPPLPPNAGVQAFPPEPGFGSQAAQGLTEASHDISKNTFGLVPDVAKDLHTFSHWGEASGGDRADAILDSASLVPGGKLLGEAHHGLDALGGVAHHADDIPTPHLDAPASVAHHGDASAPVGADHGDIGDLGGHPGAEHQHPAYSSLPEYLQQSLDRAGDNHALQHDLIDHGVPPDIAHSASSDPYAGMTHQDIINNHYTPDGRPNWPPHDGFLNGKWDTLDRIPENTRLDRIGEVSGTRGDFMATEGDSYPSRALAPGSSGDYHTFQGTGLQLPPELELRVGEVGSAFGQPGGGTQWVVVNKETGAHIFIKQLLEDGFLKTLP